MKHISEPVLNISGNDKKDDLNSRRRFIKRSLGAAAGYCLFCTLGGVKNLTAAGKTEDASRFVREAMWWDSLGKGNVVQCRLCPRECPVPDGSRGICGVRENQGGVYKTLVHSRPVAVNVDPIEKKPLFHFLPSSKAFSIAAAGCNIECKFCQNWQISQTPPGELESKYMPPDKVVENATKNECPVIAYTYSEPTVFYEYMYDTAAAGRKKNVRSVMISNGYMNEKPLRKLCRNLDAVKIDFKAFTEKFYRETCSGELKPVLHTLEVLKDEGMWFEIVVLIIPTLNDSEKENREMCRWIVKNLGPDVPVHYSRFHPTYKMRNLPRTPIKTLERCRDIAVEEGVKFAYLGNVWNHEYENTYCPECKELLIRRQGYHTKASGIKKGECSHCGEKIPGVWG